ncbi:DUF1538 domain-containing protein [Defluviitalea raffinosedens]|uniref:DUF1538 domain-containing protein n=2 Tax=Defluviitalea raffinosedens TaxID=1450156 RepID=A0A7C8HD67_9FIRM|nr:DUF1538 domain-containing protein [Defluviitalea raffinosedens]KAE9629807.1 DUF1538 domain-containing protein [Defluviitalea raffinosedens]
MNMLMQKLKEVIISVLPITLIVLLLNFTIVPIGSNLVGRFIVGAVLIILGLSIFLFGVDLGIQPIGTLMGESIAKSKKLWVVLIFGFILGFFVNIAEPDLQVLAKQVSDVTSGVISQTSLLVVVSIGIGLMVSVGLGRIVFNFPLNKLLIILYGIILILGLLAPSSILGIAFDSGGATTGSMTVPFILALGLGVSSIRGGKESEEDSFGLVGIASTGPMIAVFIMSIFSGIKELTGDLSANTIDEMGIIAPFIHEIPKISFEVTMALLPFLILFFIFQRLFFKLTKRQFSKILKGLIYTFIGFVLFLTGVNAGFMEAGTMIGYGLASLENNWIVVPIGFVLGFTVILAEPAVYVLNEQIEDVTSGHIRKKVILYTLAIGVAVAVSLSMLRIMVKGIQLWHFLLPLYVLAIVLSYFAPKIFVGIAFDSGGVASGPMTATFILAFAQGVAKAIDGADVLMDGFGVIAMVALTPLIAIQILGLIYEYKASKRS